jgi:hypothetical protein
MNIASGERLQLVFAKSYPSKSMWAPILEKAWAKVKGNYLSSNGGFMGPVQHAFTGLPAFSYFDIKQRSIKKQFKYLKESDQ